jgi:hypothetical protein
MLLTVPCMDCCMSISLSISTVKHTEGGDSLADSFSATSDSCLIEYLSGTPGRKGKVAEIGATELATLNLSPGEMSWQKRIKKAIESQGLP